ncbi:hypothetical protein [Mycobacteroides chelonae]|uniref:hypothetical protein n=1 Tax=Mycobacteroides chelonae TaxID=1774 RepID=UPI000693314D|nr:hypothetical protein [Mycobacteroides chelonae]MBF9319826.1 hypothetical protein [Mycobacteroides chelonae]OHT91496.1 hypothetical protein BKG70_02050 [Mycobacteroides chelonae]
MATTATPRLVTRADFSAKMKRQELEVFDLATHESAHAIRGLLLGGEIDRAAVYSGRVTPTHGTTRFRRAFDRDSIPPVAHAGPWAQARWLAGDRPTPGQVDAILADGGRCDHDQLLHAYAASGGWAAVDHAAEDRLLARCWPSVLSLAARMFQKVEINHLDVLAALGLDRDTSAFGLASIKAGSTPGSFSISGVERLTRF